MKSDDLDLLEDRWRSFLKQHPLPWAWFQQREFGASIFLAGAEPVGRHASVIAELRSVNWNGCDLLAAAPQTILDLSAKVRDLQEERERVMAHCQGGSRR